MRFTRICQLFQRIAFYIILLLACLLTAVTETVKAESLQNQPHVLILNSYHPNFLWADNELLGIINTLRAKFQDAQIHTEYLDTKNFPKPEHYRHLRDIFNYKYGGKKFSVILAMDNPALDFLSKFGRKLFGDTPVVFCGVSNFSPEMLKGFTSVTGVVERHDVRRTMEIMLSLHPNTKKIYVLLDNTLTSRELRRYTESVYADLKIKPGLIFMDDLSIDEILQQFEDLKQGSLILNLSFTRDREGKVLEYHDLIRLIFSKSPVPVYTIVEERMGEGVIGGYLIGGKEQGRLAAQMALRIISGEPASSIPVVTEPLSRPIFDYLQLKRFGIEESALPKGSIIINKPPTLYESYREIVLVTLGFIFLLICFIAVLLNNIRKRREAENVLAQNRNMLRQVLDVAPQSIFWKDREGVYIGCNSTFAKAVGLANTEQIIGKTDFDLPWPREEAEAYLADDREVILSKKAKKNIIEPLQQADGSRLWIETSKVPLQDAQGNAYGVLGVYEDITEKKKAEEQLYLAQFIIDNAPENIFLIDEKARFYWVNRDASSRLGYTMEELKSMSMFDLDPAFTPEMWEQHWQRLKDLGSITVETSNVTKSGEILPMEVIAKRLIYKETMYNCGYARDISDRKLAEEEKEKLEAQLRQAQKMEAIGTLAGGIAHDFNNILSVILGNAELAKLENDEPEKRLRELNQVLKGAERAKELVQQILAFSRKTEQQKQPLQISLIIKETLKMLRSSIPTTIEIRQDIKSNAAVLANPSQIHQVIMNLCTNAYHAMLETGGILAVSLDEVILEDGEYKPATLKPGRYLKLDVSDTGCGMSKDIMEKIFEPYFTTKKQGEGTGMGLAVVHGIVKSHNGHIMVYSEVGNGTSMHVYLPISEKPSVALTHEAEAQNAEGHGEHILFIDDEEQICEYVNIVLQEHGYKMAAFHDSVQALEEFNRQPDRFDLIITDMTMPHMTGAELARKALEVRPTLPIILCTGHSVLINRDKALAMGICGYLDKPFTSQKLLLAVKNALFKDKN